MPGLHFIKMTKLVGFVLKEIDTHGDRLVLTVIHNLKWTVQNILHSSCVPDNYFFPSKYFGRRFPKSCDLSTMMYADDSLPVRLQYIRKAQHTEQHNLLSHLSSSLLNLWRLEGDYMGLLFQCFQVECWHCWYFWKLIQAMIFIFVFSVGMITETMLKVVLVLGCLMSLTLAHPVRTCWCYTFDVIEQFEPMQKC